MPALKIKRESTDDVGHDVIVILNLQCKSMQNPLESEGKSL